MGVAEVMESDAFHALTLNEMADGSTVETDCRLAVQTRALDLD